MSPDSHMKKGKLFVRLKFFQEKRRQRSQKAQIVFFFISNSLHFWDAYVFSENIFWLHLAVLGTDVVKIMLIILQFTLKLDSNIESKSSNNTYLNIIEILFLLLNFFIFKIMEFKNLVVNYSVQQFIYVTSFSNISYCINCE